MKTKTYCVNVYPRCYEYENVKAASPELAKRKILNRDWPDGEEIDHVEVMLTCDECGSDNSTKSTHCEDCGAKL